MMSIALRKEGLDVVTAASASEAWYAVKHQVPDIAVLDIALPPTMTDEGLRIAENLREACPGIGLVVLSHYGGINYARRLLEIEGGARAVGYLLKDRAAGIDALLDALRRVSDGEVVIDPQLWEEYSRRPHARNRLSVLDGRQRELLALLSQGYGNASIGERVSATPDTIAGRLREIYDELGLLPDAPAREDTTLRVLAVLSLLAGTRAGSLKIERC
jgi:DNA-binding NarL/FixJ family response regulator